MKTLLLLIALAGITLAQEPAPKDWEAWAKWAEKFQILIEDNMKNVKVPAAICEAVLALKPGDEVYLKWNHDYVTRDGSSFPERTITMLKKRNE